MAYVSFNIKNSLFSDFTYGGVTYYHPLGSTERLHMDSSTGEVGFTTLTIHGENTSTIVPFTFEFQLTSNGTVGATSGQLSADSSVIRDTTYYYCPGYGPGMSFYVTLIDPWLDGRLITAKIIMRINGVIVKTVELKVFSFPTTSKITLSNSPSVQTGKVITTTVSGMQANSYAKLTTHVCAYVTDGSTTGSYNWYYWTGYLDNGLTQINERTLSSAITQFKFYVPYIDDRTRTYNFGWIKLRYTFDVSESFTTSSYDYTLDYNITWTYTDQYDNDAGPVISNPTMTPIPSDIVTTYGKYVGGGVSKINFGRTITLRYGQGVSQFVYSLYDSSTGTKTNEWTYDSGNTSFTLTLNYTIDTSKYLVVTAITTYGARTSYQYSTFQVYGYAYPSIISFNASRCNQDGTANDMGGYCKITYQFKVYALGNHNSKEVTLVAPDGSHVYTNLDYDHGSAYEYISVADIEHSYALSLTVEDDFQTVTMTRNISTAGVIMDFLYDGKGIGLGKVAENSQMVEVNPQWTLKAQTIMIKGQDLETILTSLGYVFPT